MTITTIREAHQRASSFLMKNQIDTPNLEAEIMIRHLFSWDRIKFFLNLNDIFPEEKAKELESMLQRRIDHEPLQYIIGSQEFYGREFKVNSYVLIPRPETELLVEEALKATKHTFGTNPIKMVDIGTGSGAIAITLSLEEPQWEVYTIDISKEAQDVAKENAKNLAAKKVVFYQGDLLKPAIETGLKVDMIVSNPPYIPSRDILTLMPEVKEYEPMLALDGGEDGLDLYRQIINQSTSVLNKPGIIAFEIGIGQEMDLKLLLEKGGASEIKIINDFQDIPRIVIGFF